MSDDTRVGQVNGQVKIDVTVTTHKFSRDEYIFMDDKGRPKTKDRDG